MPVVFRDRGYKFFFYSDEGTPREATHVHVRRDALEAKFWPRPEVMVAYNDGYDARTLRELARTVETIETGSRGCGMNTSVRATNVRFDSDSMWVDLSDGRVLGVPLAWFPRLLHGQQEDLDKVEISSRGLHWDALDEDISIDGLLAGLGDQTVNRKTFAA